jgi:DNA modification methylase
MEEPEQERFAFYFKLFNNLKDESEVELAERELRSIFGPVEKVCNFVDEFVSGELSQTISLLKVKSGNLPRLQDALTYELPYGKVQAFKGQGLLAIIPKLVTRLAYTKEIYVIVPVAAHHHAVNSLVQNTNVFTYRNEDIAVIRAVTNQFFLEKSAYISRLSRNTNELETNLNALLTYPKTQMYRMPATETLAVGRRLEDWFAIREEPSLYLTHYMHPYKGKFHPKMARALINYVCPTDTGIILDNFSGSGTTLVEAEWLGLNSFGIDINPLSSLMSRVKVQCLNIDIAELKQAIDDFLSNLTVAEQQKNLDKSGQSTLFVEASRVNSVSTSNISLLPGRVRQSLPEEQIENVMLADSLLKAKYGALNHNPIHEFLLLGVSGTISDLSRRTSQPFQEVLRARLYNLWGRIYLAKRLQTILGIKFGTGECFIGDTRDMKNLKTLGGSRRSVEDDSIDCVVNSPPYSTALDYIRNDLPQLSILRLARDPNELEKNLIGNPNLKFYSPDLITYIVEESEMFFALPEEGKSILKHMVNAGRDKEAGRVLKFWEDMRLTLLEIKRVLKPSSGRAAIVIGDNNIQLSKGTDRFDQVPNIKVIEEISKKIGLHLIETINRDIEKSLTGMIRNEAVVIVRK